jgi:hypothetical protein
MEKAKSAPLRLVLRIALRDIEPTIRRRVTVDDDISLGQFRVAGVLRAGTSRSKNGMTKRD